MFDIVYMKHWQVEHVIKEQNMLDVYDMLEGYCNLLTERIHLIEHDRFVPYSHFQHWFYSEILKYIPLRIEFKSSPFKMVQIGELQNG